MNPFTNNVFTSPGKPVYVPPHPNSLCTVSQMRTARPVATATAITTAPHHPYRMPLVQNSCTKAVKNSDLSPTGSNGHHKHHDAWVEKL